MTVLEQIQNDTHRVSQSRLKRLLGEKPNRYLQETKQTEDMQVGSAVEAILLEGKEIFIESTQSFSDSVKKCVEYLMFWGKPLSAENILSWAIDEGYGESWKPKTRIHKILDGGAEEYYKLMTSDKFIFSPDIASLVRDLAIGLSQVPVIQEIMERKYAVQKEVHFDYDDVLCKGVIDLLDMSNNQIVDIKVTGMPVTMAARKLRWDIQGAFYAESFDDCPPPIFVVAKTYDPNNPLVYKMSEADMTSGKYGAVSSGIHRPGFHDLIQIYKWHSQNNLWDKPKEHYEQGFSYLNLFS